MKREVTEFFRSRPGYNRLFRGIWKKYVSLGRLGGTVVLNKLTSAEQQMLSEHFRRDYSRQKSAKVSVQKFADSLRNTRFAEFRLEDILQAYFGKPLVSASDLHENFLVERKKYFASLKRKYYGQLGEKWLGKVEQEQAVGFRKVLGAYRQDRAQLTPKLTQVCDALDVIDKRSIKFWRLPVFASLISKNPHTFDLSSETGQLLLDALCTVFETPRCTNRQEMAEVLYAAGILIDEISNYVTCAGLLASTDRFGIEEPHPVWQAALDCGEILQIPLANLGTIKTITSTSNAVYVVENPGVFSAILDAISDFLPPLVCTTGQLKLAGLVLLDKLVDTGATLYYSGDFDPEGLTIAHRLAERYGTQFRLWRYTIEDYRECLSQERISGRRLKMLSSITDSRFASIKEAILDKKIAGYQEMLVNKLITDIDA